MYILFVKKSVSAHITNHLTCIFVIKHFLGFFLSNLTLARTKFLDDFSNIQSRSEITLFICRQFLFVKIVKRLSVDAVWIKHAAQLRRLQVQFFHLVPKDNFKVTFFIHSGVCETLSRKWWNKITSFPSFRWNWALQYCFLFFFLHSNFPQL